MCGSAILLAFLHAREVGVSSRNLVSRTFPQFLSVHVDTYVLYNIASPFRRKEDIIEFVPCITVWRHPRIKSRLIVFEIVVAKELLFKIH